MGKIARYLNQLTIGNVFDTPDILEAYSTDRSALKIRPKFVALPESTEDVRKIMRFCYQLAARGIKIPVTVRGSGLNEGGSDLGNGLILSTKKLNHLFECDKRERLVRVQAGITLKELNTALSLNGLTIPVGGHDNDTIGGLIASNPKDDYFGKYGGISKYVERIEAVLANGEILQTDRMSYKTIKRKGSEETLEGRVYHNLSELMRENGDTIENLQKGHLDKAGYPTIGMAIKGKTIDVKPLFFGSEGTLGVITEVILRAVPINAKTARAVATFEDFTTAEKFLDVANSLKPRELFVYDLRIIKVAEESGKRLSPITGKMKSGYVVFVKFDHRAKSAVRKLWRLRKVLPESSQLLTESQRNQVALDEFENSLTSFIAQARRGERVPILTDFYLPSSNLVRFVSDMQVLEDSLRLDTAIFGSYSSSIYSLRPKFNLADEDFNKKATAFLRTGAFIIKRQGGVLAGGTPEGRIKAIATNEDLPENLKVIYLAIKDTFDQQGILNPGVKLGADARQTVRHFRDNGPVDIEL